MTKIRVSDQVKCVLLTGFSEFAYLGDRIVYDSHGTALNALYEQKTLNIAPTNPDIRYILDRMNRLYPNLNTVLVWTNWMMNLQGNTVQNAAENIIRPYISQDVKNFASANWSVGAFNASNAPVCPLRYLAGTPTDDSLLWILRELKNQGYKVGLYGVFIGLPHPVWRGDMFFASDSLFFSWIDEYKNLYYHYRDLLISNNVNLDYFLIGSEMLSTTSKKVNGTYPLVDALVEINDSVKASLPNTKTVYAANWDEYFNGTDFNFPLDQLFCRSNFDIPGIDAYWALTPIHTNNPDEIRAGITSGEDWDAYHLDWGPGGARLSSSLKNDRGRSAGVELPLARQFAKKRIEDWYNGYHWRSAVGGKVGSTSLKSVFLDLHGSGTQTNVAPKGSGVFLDNLSATNCWFPLSTNFYLDGKFPFAAATGYDVELTFELDGVGSSQFPRLLRIADCLDVFCPNSNSIQVEVGGVYSAAQPLSLNTPYVYKLEITSSRTDIYLNGFLLQTLTASPAMPTVATDLFVNSYSGGSDFCTGKIYVLMLRNRGKSLIDGTYQWNFEEASRGYKSSWQPALKQLAFTELGIASIKGSSTSPNVFPDFTDPDPYLPFNSSGKADLFHQVVGLNVLLDHWNSKPYLEFVCVYNIDARPHELFRLKLDDGTYYFRDWVNWELNHSLNGKLVEQEVDLFSGIPDIHRAAISPIVEMFELSNYDPTDSNTVFRFCNVSGVIWQGNTYQSIPCQTEGFEFQTSGSLPRPKIRISNVKSIVSSLIADYRDLIGAKLVRKRTLFKYLDNQPQANTSAALPDDIWYVDRKTLENDTVIEWELASSLDLEGLQLPRRAIVANTCLWQYRSSECSYAGGPVAKVDDTPTSDPAQDVCGKRISSCKLRFGENAVLPFGGFPGCNRL